MGVERGWVQTLRPSRGIAGVDNLLMESHAHKYSENDALQSKAQSLGLKAKASRTEDS